MRGAPNLLGVMAGLDPVVSCVQLGFGDGDARIKSGHDGAAGL